VNQTLSSLQTVINCEVFKNTKLTSCLFRDIGYGVGFHISVAELTFKISLEVSIMNGSIDHRPRDSVSIQ